MHVQISDKIEDVLKVIRAHHVSAVPIVGTKLSVSLADVGAVLVKANFDLDAALKSYARDAVEGHLDKQIQGTLGDTPLGSVVDFVLKRFLFVFV